MSHHNVAQHEAIRPERRIRPLVIDPDQIAAEQRKRDTSPLPAVTPIPLHPFNQPERSVERLQSLLDVLPAAVLVVDGSGRIQECNPAAEALLGTPLSSMLWRDVIARAFAPQQGAGDELALRNGRYVALSTCPLANEPGQILLLNDVTETRELRQHLERHRRLADMGRMAANLAHQIRTPLSSALLYASHLKQRDITDARRQRFAERTVASLRGLEQLINDMLLFARGERGEVREIAPQQLLDQVTTALSDEMAAAEVTYRIEDQSDQAILHANPVLLESAIKNLVTNAIDALDSIGGGEITLSAVRSSDHLELRIRDNGPGIPAALQKRIFEPFETTRERGSGLGLAVARTVARAHQGELQLDSEPGRGATFTMRLPLPVATPLSQHHGIAP